MCCFALGFQQNHASTLKGLLDRVKKARENGGKEFVSLSLLENVAKIEVILGPVFVMKLIDLAKKELDGCFELFEKCRSCHGFGEVYSWVYGEPEIVESVVDIWNKCSRCCGSGWILSTEAKQYPQLVDKKALVDAVEVCSTVKPTVSA